MPRRASGCGSSSSHDAGGLPQDRLFAAHPGTEQLVAERDDDRAQKDADQAIGQKPADDADQDDHGRHVDAAAHQKGLQHIVDQDDRNAPTVNRIAVVVPALQNR